MSKNHSRCVRNSAYYKVYPSDISLSGKVGCCLCSLCIPLSKQRYCETKVFCPEHSTLSPRALAWRHIPGACSHLWDHSISHLWLSKKHCCSCLAFQDFFLNVKDILRRPEDTTPSAHNYHELEKDLQDKYGSLCFPLLAWIYKGILSSNCLFLIHVPFKGSKHHRVAVKFMFPISCLLARCINDVKRSFTLNWWINIGFYGLRSNSLNAKICRVLLMLNKQNERREWAGEGGGWWFLTFISQERGDV